MSTGRLDRPLFHQLEGGGVRRILRCPRPHKIKLDLPRYSVRALEVGSGEPRARVGANRRPSLRRDVRNVLRARRPTPGPLGHLRRDSGGRS
jgi:hypothetical protein